ncbi:protein kinase, partial [Xenorhabdus bovienii]|uniref:protein kinase domain-containing protein n=1 Tax=Xenorhabdus bovienii TaxID=40576 RepID=UPI0023B3048C
LAENHLGTELGKDGLQTDEKIRIINMILNGIKYMHEIKRYLHRDLKLENILKFPDGIYKVSDFGLVKNTNKESESEVLTNIAVEMGT